MLRIKGLKKGEKVRIIERNKFDNQIGGTIMGMFDDLCGKAKDVADAAGKKTGEIVELTKYKMKASQLHSDIRAAHEKLGSAVYSMVKADYENPELINSMAEEIDELMAKLKEIEDKISELKRVVKCPCCGANNAQDSSYCSQCGCKLGADFSKQEEKIVVETPDEDPVEPEISADETPEEPEISLENVEEDKGE